MRNSKNAKNSKLNKNFRDIKPVFFGKQKKTYSFDSSVAKCDLVQFSSLLMEDMYG